MFGDEIGVLTQSVAGPRDLEDDGMVQQSVEQRGGDHGITTSAASVTAPSWVTVGVSRAPRRSRVGSDFSRAVARHS